jgi:hypothetical protein
MGLELVVRCTKALTVCNIKRLATITKLDDVVSIHPVLRVCPAAPVAMVIDGLAPGASTGDHPTTPGLELACVVDRVSLLGRLVSRWWLGGAGVEASDQWAESTELGHRTSLQFVLKELGHTVERVDYLALSQANSPEPSNAFSHARSSLILETLAHHAASLFVELQPPSRDKLQSVKGVGFVVGSIAHA